MNKVIKQLNTLSGIGKTLIGSLLLMMVTAAVYASSPHLSLIFVEESTTAEPAEAVSSVPAMPSTPKSAAAADPNADPNDCDGDGVLKRRSQL